MQALKLTNLQKSYKSRRGIVRAVDDVSFYVDEGETVGLLGMNGAGKTTTVKMCTGLVVPDGGRAEVFGHDIVRDEEGAKRLLNVSPQETAVALNLSVRENLELAARIYGADKQKARHDADGIIERFKLEDKRNERAKKLSGGLMRRLSVGMALITDPRLVFLDEPTLGLDVVARRELWRFIKQLKDTAVVLTTHYLEEAEALCDRIVIMKKGKVAAIGTADELKALAEKATFEDAFLAISGEEVGDEQ